MASFINIKGGKELQEFLNTLAPKIERNIMRGAVRAGAGVILQEAKSNVSIDSGDLRDSLRVTTSAKKGRVTASVKAGNKKVFYSGWVEFGTAAHSITARGNRALSFGGLFTKSVLHPGARAKPFLRPSLDSKANEAIEEVGKYIGKRLTKQGINNSPSLEVEKD